MNWCIDPKPDNWVDVFVLMFMIVLQTFHFFKQLHGSYLFIILR